MPDSYYMYPLAIVYIIYILYIRIGYTYFKYKIYIHIAYTYCTCTMSILLSALWL